MSKFWWGYSRIEGVADPYPLHKESTMAHSKEPWEMAADGAHQNIQIHHGHVHIATLPPDSSDDARRIIACVNILAGVPTEVLEYVASVGLRVSVTCDPFVPAPGAAPRVNCFLDARLEPAS